MKREPMKRKDDEERGSIEAHKQQSQKTNDISLGRLLGLLFCGGPPIPDSYFFLTFALQPKQPPQIDIWLFGCFMEMGSRDETFVRIGAPKGAHEGFIHIPTSHFPLLFHVTARHRQTNNPQNMNRILFSLFGCLCLAVTSQH